MTPKAILPVQHRQALHPLATWLFVSSPSTTTNVHNAGYTANTRMQARAVLHVLRLRPPFWRTANRSRPTAPTGHQHDRVRPPPRKRCQRSRTWSLMAKLASAIRWAGPPRYLAVFPIAFQMGPARELPLQQRQAVVSPPAVAAQNALQRPTHQQQHHGGVARPMDEEHHDGRRRRHPQPTLATRRWPTRLVQMFHEACWTAGGKASWCAASRLHSSLAPAWPPCPGRPEPRRRSRRPLRRACSRPQAPTR